MPQQKNTILYLNENILSTQVYNENLFLETQLKSTVNSSTINQEKINILDALKETSYNKIKSLDCNIIFKIYYKLFQQIFYSFSNTELNGIKVYSEHNIYYYILKNHPNLINNFYNTNKNYKGFNAYKDYYSYYYSLFEDNKCALPLLNAHIVLSNFENQKNLIIEILKTIEISENKKITPLLWKKKDKFYDIPHESINYDLDSTKFNTQLKFSQYKIENKELISIGTSGTRMDRYGCFTLRLFPQKTNSTTKFVGNTTKTADDMVLDLKNNKTITLASIYEMFDYYLETMNFRYHNINVDEIYRIKQSYMDKKEKIPSSVRQFTDIDYIKTFEGKPWERYFIIEFFIKNNLINESKMIQYLKPKNLIKYYEIKNKGLSSLD
jgi:hypothetical protein